MNKQEIITEIQNGLNRYFVMYVTKEKEKKFLSDICCMLESLREPETLAEFLGWEENVEYVYDVDKFIIMDNELYIWNYTKKDWIDANMVSINRFEVLRQAKKLKLKKYYLRHKYLEGKEHNYLNLKTEKTNCFYLTDLKEMSFKHNSQIRKLKK